jgi:hypothetical protein
MRIPPGPASGNFLFKSAPGGDAVPAQHVDKATPTEQLPLKE